MERNISKRPIKTPNAAVTAMTTIVDANNSSRVLHATFPSSALTSFIKLTGLANIPITFLC